MRNAAIVALVYLMVISSFVVSAQVENPVDPLGIITCGVGCYSEIVPGISTEDDLLTLLSQENESYDVGSLGFSGVLKVYNFGPLNNETYIREDPNAISVDVGDGTVEAILILLRDFTVTDVMAAYGAPSSITHDVSTVMIYAHYGLIFTVNNENDSDILFVEIIAAGSESPRLQYFLTWPACHTGQDECSIAVATATPTPTPSPTQPPTTPTFYRAINLGGDPLTIVDNPWDGQNASNYTTNGAALCNPYVPLDPPTDANRTAMINCFVEHWAHELTLTSVPNGTYDVSPMPGRTGPIPTPSRSASRLRGNRLCPTCC